ncbi:hybrid sensor histidine kinase/response regulator [Duganella callida]|uniref:hybrid sensor histidine kinase/response regulator n=1 Tax=Duganella callida TaxID=2561932 RepID=UPI0014306B14|nr:PAS domain S-box protein [Duganella callida]
MIITVALSTLLAVAEAGRRRRHEVLAGQARLAAIVDSSADAIIGKDLQGRITSWNRGAERLFGYSAEQALGRTVGELLVPPHLQHEERAILRRLSAGETVPDVETQRQHRDGHLIDVWVAVAPVRHPDGSVIGAAKTVRDITERRAAELRVRAANARLEDTVAQRTAQLRDTNLMLSNVLDAATGVAIIACANDGSITVFNRGAERMLGYQADELLHRATPMRFHDGDEVAARAAELSTMEGRPVDPFRAVVLVAERAGAETREWTYVRRDGGRLAVSLIVTAMYGAQGERAGYLGVAMDITQRRELLSSLEQAKEQALAASAAKSNFLANMSHEIRTPMNAVLGMLQLVQGTALAPRQRDFVAKADSAARALLQLLNDVLDYSKIEAGKLQLDPHPFDVDALLRDLAVILAGNQGDKDVEVIFDLDPRLPPILIGDRLRLQQILINLAGNALKFTARGHVTVALQVLACDGGRLRLQVSVADSGIGIGAEQQARIFDGFTQAEASISRRYGGSGLGLVISRRLLALMDSQLQLESRPGHGSRFWFELTLGYGEAAPSPQAGPLAVLVTHAHAAAGAALQRMCNGLGWRVAVAACAGEACALLRSQPFDAVLLQAALAQREEVVQQLAEQAQPPALVLLTAAGNAAETATVLGLPATPQQLAAAVRHAREAPATDLAAPPAPQRLVGLRVLLVEDNALNREVAGQLLANEGALVELAENGSDGVQRVLRAATLPDVVLMDMQMPEMDGLEATRRIRAAVGSGLRIVAMTANAGDGDRAACLAAGMNEHVGKPIDLELLVRCLRQPGAVAPSAPAGVDPGDGDEPLAATLARFGGDTGLYRRALSMFGAQSQQLADQAVMALRQGDRAGAAAALHTYKGLAATLGARALAAEVKTLEQAHRQEHTDAGMAERINALCQLGEETRARLLRRLDGDQPAPMTDAMATVAASAGAVALELDVLEQLLASANMRALQWVERLAGEGDPVLAQVARCLNELNFARALDLLHGRVQVPVPAVAPV